MFTLVNPLAVIRSASFRQCCLAVALAALGTGCSTYTERNQALTRPWESGNFPAAAAEASRMAEKTASTHDAIIWKLEEGATWRVAGDFPKSNQAFDAAEAGINRYERAAKVSLSDNFLATLSNQENMPYEGYAYDKVMVNTYKALNYLQLGDLEKARVEFIRTYQRQQDAVRINSERIEKAEQAGKEKSVRSYDDPAVQGRLNSTYSEMNNMKSYAPYVNPFAVFMDGLFFLHTALDASDLERANKSFERMPSLIGSNKFLQQDQQTVRDVMGGKKIQPLTYVILETGRAPIRDQVRIDIPILISRVSYIGAAFPKLEFRGNYLTHVTVNAAGATETTVQLASMDSVIAQDFKNELPMIVTRTLIASAAKGAAAYALNNAAQREDELVGLLAQIGTAIAQMAVNIADLRTWTTLPKEFQYCRINTPADRKVLITAPNGQKAEVAVEPGQVNIIFVKSINATGPMVVSQCKLK